MEPTDLRDFADLRSPAGLRWPAADRRLGRFVGAVVEGLTAPFEPKPGEQALALRCMGRKKPRCSGRIDAGVEGQRAWWRCPRCGDEGSLLGWQGGPWDLAELDTDAFEESALATVRLAGPVMEALCSIPVLDRAAERVLATARRTGARGVVVCAPEAWLGHLAEFVASELNHTEETEQYQRRLEQAYQALARYA